jgi:ATP-dependent DNA helicase RecG
LHTSDFDERYFRTLLAQLLVQAPDALENERLEIKSWCRDEHELINIAVDAACCLANAEGGYVLIGIGEKEYYRFSKCQHPNVSPQWLALRIQDQTHPPVACRCHDLTQLLTELRGVGGDQVYALEVERTSCLSGHTNAKGISKIRVGKECRVQYTADDDRTNAVVPNVSKDDLSLESIRWAMSQHRRSFSAPGTSDDPWGFLEQGRLLQSRGDSVESVTMAALILFGKQAALGRVAPYCQTVFKTRSGHEDLRKNVVETVRDLLFGEQPRLRGFAPLVPGETLHELLVNAYMHRCWRTNGPVVITVSEGSVEIVNPGDLLPGLHVDTLIHCIPVYRNLLLAEGLRYIGLADKIGQGIDIVFRSLICAGLDFPCFESENNRFSVRLPLAQLAVFQEFVRSRAASLSNLDELVVLRYLWGHREATIGELGTALQRGRDATQRITYSMAGKTMIQAESGGYRLADGLRRDIESIFSRDQLGLFGN